MSLLTEIKDKVTDAVENVKDSVSSIGHKTNAETEADYRTAAGDALTPAETVGSYAREGKETILGDVDQAKVDYRNEI